MAGDPSPRDLARHAERAIVADALFSPRPPSAGTPIVLPALVLPPRSAWVQADYDLPRGAPGSALGSVPWEELVTACDVAPRRDPERVAGRGGMRWSEMVSRLGREPRGWRRA